MRKTFTILCLVALVGGSRLRAQPTNQPPPNFLGKLAAGRTIGDTVVVMIPQTAPLEPEAAGLPAIPELLEIARRVCWWKKPEETLAASLSFVARVMTLGSWDEVRAVRAQVGDVPFRRVLQQPPAGIFDARSWHYWHHALGFVVVPPLPQRRIP